MTIKEYWNLIVWETFFAVTCGPDFSQVCRFCKMLINHKNFHYTQISDKFNDAIFLRSPKIIFYGQFWHELIPRRLTERRKDRWKGGRKSYLIGPFRLRIGIQKNWWVFPPSSLSVFIPLNLNQTKSVSPQTANVSWLWKIHKYFPPLIKFMFHVFTDSFEQI